MEALSDRLISIAVLLILVVSRLFWLRRLIDLGVRFIPRRWRRAGLKGVVVGTRGGEQVVRVGVYFS